MPRKKKITYSSTEIQSRQKASGIVGTYTLFSEVLEDKPTTLEGILQLLKKFQRKKSTEMICFILYDISDHKVRREVSKYLLRKGCQRVQKSVFLVKVEHKLFREIHETLTVIQECYENNDSILLVPISENELQKMKMIGQNLCFEFTMGKKNTLFF